jgi:hypothetical protein
MQTWAQQEVGHAQFGDRRLSKRLVRIVTDLSDHPEASVPQASGDWAATKAVYRFWDHQQVTPEAIRAAHRESTVQRLAGHETVLAIQDTTSLSLGSHRATKGLGPIDSHQTPGLLVHSVLVTTAHGVPLGVLHQQVWARDPAQHGKSKKRHAVPISEKESYRWLQSLQATEQAVPTGTHIVTIADREADIYDLFAMPRAASMDLLIRANTDRNVGTDPQVEKLWQRVQRTPVRGQMTVHLEHRAGQRERDVTVSVRWASVTLYPSSHDAIGLHPVRQPIPLMAVLVQEEGETSGPEATTQEPLCWMLLTTLPVDTFEQAAQCVHWYRLRWVIERYHLVLKSGCRIEELQVETAARLERALATYSIVAWRLLWLIYEARQQPEMSCEVVLQPYEWQALYAQIHQSTTVPLTPPTLREATRWIAQLGGFLARTSDGEPGVQTLWRGWRRLEDVAAMWLLLHPPSSLLS